MIEKDKYIVNGEIFKAYRKDLGLTQQQISHCLGVDQSYISKIENGEKNLSLETFTKTTNLFLCEPQHLTQPSSRPRYYYTSLKSTNISPKSFSNITKLQAIIAAQYSIDFLQPLECSETNESTNSINNLQLNEKFDNYSNYISPNEQDSLIPQLDELFASISKKTISKDNIHFFANQFRLLLGITDLKPFDFFKVILEKIYNLTIIFEELEEKITGISYKGQKSNIIVINKTLSLAKQRHSLACELFHLYYENTCIKSISTTDKRNEEKNRLANLFATYLLLPDHVLAHYLHAHQAYNQDCDKLRLILELEHYYQISHQEALNRLAEIINIDDIPTDEKTIVELAQQYGFDSSIYSPYSPPLKTNGYYINKVIDLYKSNHINEIEMCNYLVISRKP